MPNDSESKNESKRKARTMWCRRAVKQLVPYLDGRLRMRRHAAVSEHIDRCGRCAAAAEGLEALRAALDRGAEAAVPSEFEAEVFRRIRSAEARREEMQWRRWLVPLAAGAAAVGVAFYLGLGLHVPEQDVSPGDLDKLAMAPAPGLPRPWETPGPQAVPSTRAVEVSQGQAPEPVRETAPTTLETASDAPRELVDALDLFIDFPIIQQLEKFEHYETIGARPQDGSTSATRGG
jgi:hypothetical protein